MTQFDELPLRTITLPFVDNRAKIKAAIEQIDRSAAQDAAKPLVFSSLIDAEHRKQIKTCQGIVFDFFDAFLGPLARELGVKPKEAAGLSHGMGEVSRYDQRVEAVNFALSYDDGARLHDLGHAEAILIGVSRSGKTPTCLYLAMHYGVRAANYPLTQEDLDRHGLPESLQAHRERLFGLTISPERLRMIRQERRPGSSYASLAQCRLELLEAENLFKMYNVPFLDTSTISIEEIASAVMQEKGIARRVI